MAISERLKRIYASAPADELYMEVLILEHSLFEQTWFLTNHPTQFDATWNALTETFLPIPFNAVWPKNDGKGQQDLRIVIGNVDRRVGRNIELANGDPTERIKCFYTQYVEGDPDPQIDPAFTLELTNIEVNQKQVSAVATKANIVNAPFPREIYRIDRWPGLDR